MKNTYIIIIVLIVLVIGAGLFFGMREKAQAPISETPTVTPPATTITTTTTTTTTTPAVKEFIVSGQNFSFTPSTITVKKGDKVKITFSNVNGFHNFVIDAYGVATKASQSPDTEILEFTADKVGSFEYYCSVGTHRAMGMKGTLKVE